MSDTTTALGSSFSSRASLSAKCQSAVVAIRESAPLSEILLELCGSLYDVNVAADATAGGKQGNVCD